MEHAGAAGHDDSAILDMTTEVGGRENDLFGQLKTKTDNAYQSKHIRNIFPGFWVHAT